MSGNNDEEKPEGSKVFPLDLASKLTMKPIEVTKGAPLMMTAQPLRGMRVLTPAAGAGNTSVAGQTISIVPQAMIKQVDTLQRTQLGIISSHGQAQAQTVARPAQITIATSVVGQAPSTGATYHVPRGPAVVANLATPRSAVATPIRASGVATTPPGQATGYVTTVRQVAPPRTPSPAGTALQPGTTWLSSSGMQVQTGAQLVKTVGGIGAAGSAVLSTNLQRIPASVGSGTPVSGSRTQVVARTQTNAPGTGARQAVLHSAQIHSYKTTGGIQAIGNAVTLALPTRTQTLVYTGGSGNATQHFTASPRIAVTGTINSQRQITATRPGQVMATRLAVPVTVNQATTRLAVTPATQGIYSTGTRISAAPTQNTVIGSNTARIAVTNQQPGAVGRLPVSSPPGTLLAGTQARLSVPNNPAQQQPSAVVIATQAGRLAASVVSLHPVMVANSAQTARTIQTQGPKVITQQSQGQAIQLAQVPTVAKLPPQQATVVPVTVTVASTPTRTINVTPAAIVSQRPVNVSQAIPIAKVFPQTNRAPLESNEGPASVQQTSQPTNVYIHTTPMVRRSTSPGPANSGQTEIQRNPTTTSVATYSLPTGTAYFYETSSGYPVTGGNLVARPFTPSSGSFAAVPQSAPTQIRSTGITTQVHGLYNV